MADATVGYLAAASSFCLSFIDLFSRPAGVEHGAEPRKRRPSSRCWSRERPAGAEDHWAARRHRHRRHRPARGPAVAVGRPETRRRRGDPSSFSTSPRVSWGSMAPPLAALGRVAARNIKTNFICCGSSFSRVVFAIFQPRVPKLLAVRVREIAISLPAIACYRLYFGYFPSNS